MLRKISGNEKNSGVNSLTSAISSVQSIQDLTTDLYSLSGMSNLPSWIRMAAWVNG